MILSPFLSRKIPRVRVVPIFCTRPFQDARCGSYLVPPRRRGQAGRTRCRARRPGSRLKRAAHRGRTRCGTLPDRPGRQPGGSGGLKTSLQTSPHEFRSRLRDDRVSVGAQASHSGGNPISQRECAGFNWPPPSIPEQEPVSSLPVAVHRAGVSFPIDPTICERGMPVSHTLGGLTPRRASAAVGVGQPARFAVPPVPFPFFSLVVPLWLRIHHAPRLNFRPIENCPDQWRGKEYWGLFHFPPPINSH